jgi:hypothetical protein
MEYIPDDPWHKEGSPTDPWSRTLRSASKAVSQILDPKAYETCLRHLDTLKQRALDSERLEPTFIEDSDSDIPVENMALNVHDSAADPVPGGGVGAVSGLPGPGLSGFPGVPGSLFPGAFPGIDAFPGTDAAASSRDRLNPAKTSDRLANFVPHGGVTSASVSEASRAASPPMKRKGGIFVGMPQIQ